jgi:hypothetical protein
MKLRLVVISFAACAFIPAASGHNTRAFLEAPRVKSELRVRWNTTTTELQWAADNDTTFRAVDSGATFLTSRSFPVTYPRLNPLRIRVTTKVENQPDPNAAIYQRLADAITSVGTGFGSSAAAAEPAAKGAREAAGRPAREGMSKCTVNVNDLEDRFWLHPMNGPAMAKEWPGKMDTAFNSSSGPAAVTAGVTAIQGDIGTVNKAVEDGRSAVTELYKCATSAATPKSSAAFNSFANLLAGQVAALSKLAADFTRVQETLAPFGDDQKWMGDGQRDFILIGEVRPDSSTMRHITVTVDSINAVDTGTGALFTTTKNLGSQTFDVRQFSRFAPEIGAGAVFATVRQPKYGTAQRNGQTVVARVSDSSVSINPTVLVNFVCRCVTGPLRPMVQIGAVASKDTPGILTGAGFRLFTLGNGGVAVGGGAMFGWVKDLKTLQPGQVVSGTAAIEADLGFRTKPDIGGYFTIQYNFGK